jgi:hypothetical protein
MQGHASASLLLLFMVITWPAHLIGKEHLIVYFRVNRDRKNVVGR